LGAVISQDKAESRLKTKDEGMILMRMNLERCVRVLAVAAGVGISGCMAQAAGAPFFQDHDQKQDQSQDKDYSKNKTYQQGMREGQDDHAHNRDHSKKRHFKKDEDQKAYEAGYQKGHGN
jgi:Ni/Co efflux regulator RcnB